MMTNFKMNDKTDIYILVQHVPQIGEEVRVLNDIYIVDNVQYRIGTDELTIFLIRKKID